MQRKQLTIGHVPLDQVTHAEAIDLVDQLIAEGRGGYVVTPNIDHIVIAHRDVRLRDVYEGASLSLPDGQPLVWMARLLGAGTLQRVSGSDLIEPLMAHAASHRRHVFFFGASPEVSAEAERRLVARHPGLRVVGRDCSFWKTDDVAPEASPVVRAVRESGAELVIVALGCPKQEIWMARHAAALAPAVAIGLGGALDFAAGAVARAPAWVSHAGLEWLFRLAQEPRRLAYRYLVRDLQILPILATEACRQLTGWPRAIATPRDRAERFATEESSKC